MIGQKPSLIESYINLAEQLQPNGFDLTLKEVAMIQTEGRIAVSNANRQISSLSPLVFDGTDNVDLVAGSYVITFNEIVNMPKNVMALGAPRSSLLRCGVTVHMAMDYPRFAANAKYKGKGRAKLVMLAPGALVGISDVYVLVAIIGGGACLVKHREPQNVANLVLAGMPAKLAKELMNQIHQVMKDIDHGHST